MMLGVFVESEPKRDEIVNVGRLEWLTPKKTEKTNVHSLDVGDREVTLMRLP